ncbi:MAG: hypothetical protein J5601_03730 [Elusimicrobiaceae bacterium]|nr:hypothetical protein [Elusimicrobiaceae bacterium]
MAKKDFSKVNTAPIYEAITEATAEAEPMPEKIKYKDRRTYTAAEAQEAMEKLRTTGLKGVKLPRINLAFSPTNYDFVQTMARVRGESMTDFINFIMNEAREKHAETYKAAIAFRDAMDREKNEE